MSVNRMTVKELVSKLKEYSEDMEVVVVRHPEYAVTSGIEFDGIDEIATIIVHEEWSVHKLGGDYKVLLLSATPIADIKDP